MFTSCDVLERFIGDPLRASADRNSTGRIYKRWAAENFIDDVVSYRNFKATVEGLSGLKPLGSTVLETLKVSRKASRRMTEKVDWRSGR